MADLTIMGAGAFGLSIAFAAARRGARVRVIDPGGPGAGASGGVVGALAPHAPEGWDALKAFQWEALLKAEDWWRAVEEAGGLSPGYARLGRLQPLRDEPAVARARERQAGAADHWGAAATWRVIPASDAGPFAPASPSGWLIHDTASARLSPSAACAALAAAVTALGGEVLREGASEGPVIWATGAAGLSEAGLGGGVKGQALLLRLDRRTAPQISAPGLHIVPHADGTVAIGSTTEPEAEGLGTDHRLDKVLAKAASLIPELGSAPVLTRWAGLRPRARQRLLLGRWQDGYIANGGYKIGLGLAPLVGERMAELVLDGHADIPGEFTP
ncbi:FAD-dependent oxidoreductase [Pseudoroseicyclus tamaricis]|uniref:FAD-dependent oxidoreductase n=1 Tax=Pseudoroseicyclus tamaricis TaxID=2705421 RepID=A0A6B2JER8_9RHOB|nr:FAD-dependent oxidoreductase [Pseudoroseicyclus tamaricis]NDU99402.1 FAD-dependent oxidoreductase [Pseudoroseicyclus tamaricis]